MQISTGQPSKKLTLSHFPKNFAPTMEKKIGKNYGYTPKTFV